MKRRFPIPYADPAFDARIADLGTWLWQWGWRIDQLAVERNYLHDPLAKYRVTVDGRHAGVPAKLEVFSGAVLVYDDEERTLGVTDQQPEPEPEDEIPAQWREPQDAVAQAATVAPEDRPYLWPISPLPRAPRRRRRA